MTKKYLSEHMKVRQKKGVFSKAKISLKGIIVTAVISGAIFAGCSDKGETSPEHLRKKELEEKCAYILPPEGKKSKYLLVNGKSERIVEVEHYDPWGWRDDCLKIYLDDVIFESKGTSLEEMRKLKILYINKGSEWEVFPEGQIKNYDLWQKKYEELIDKINDTRKKFEGDTLENAKY